MERFVKRVWLIEYLSISFCHCRIVQSWIEEMSAYVKSIDQNHLLTVGLEGFYGPTSPPEKLSINPGEWFSMLGSDFIRNSKIPTIDFASVHVYPDNW